ncbi:hypothetical protein, partial [Pannonibacter sp.]|uniref:hypothetical protein n=1 Tax=Pannonibacter sp. TaxID=1906786 RepID=UPI003F724FBE
SAGGITEAENHLENARHLFRSTEPALLRPPTRFSVISQGVFRFFHVEPLTLRQFRYTAILDKSRQI